ncbi:MAG TPA: hypothetical protein GXX75_02565 [Clostridiales bacterium]|nr:hypothetical protein [Clostridiales bacterium]
MIEKKYESDLTLNEKVRFEWKKIKSLRGQKRVEYLWTYYWYLIFVALAVVLVIGTGITMLRNQQRTQVLSIAIIDTDLGKMAAMEELEENLLQYIGQEDKHDEVVIDTSASSADTEENMAKLVMVMSVLSDTDVVVCNQEVYDRFHKESVFLDWKEILGDECEEYEAYMADDVIDLSRIKKWKEGGYTSYSPAYLCVLKKSKHLEQARYFLDYFLE